MDIIMPNIMPKRVYGTGAPLCVHEVRDGKGRYMYLCCVKSAPWILLCKHPSVPIPSFSMLHAEKREAGNVPGDEKTT